MISMRGKTGAVTGPTCTLRPECCQSGAPWDASAASSSSPSPRPQGHGVRCRCRLPWSPCCGHRAEQEGEQAAARDTWTDHNLVFATELGTPVDPRNILRTVQIAAHKAGM